MISFKLIKNIKSWFSADRVIEEYTSTGNVPEHIALIMDGNGRWAKKQGKNRVWGHKHGVDRIKPLIELASKIGIKCISFYAFSKENWQRPKEEVDFLMNLLENYLDNERESFLKSGAHLKVIGDKTLLSERIQKKIEEFERTLQEQVEDPKILVNLAVSYGGKDEIVRAVNRSIQQNINEKSLKISEEMIETNLDSPSYPRIDLLIRTSGEQRISNFMLWELAYAEFYFTDVLWPDFSEKEFLKAIDNYSKRNRRFGKV